MVTEERVSEHENISIEIIGSEQKGERTGAAVGPIGRPAVTLSQPSVLETLGASVSSPAKRGSSLLPTRCQRTRPIKPSGQPPDTSVGDSTFVLQIRNLKLKGAESLSSVGDSDGLLPRETT